MPTEMGHFGFSPLNHFFGNQGFSLQGSKNTLKKSVDKLNTGDETSIILDIMCNIMIHDYSKKERIGVMWDFHMILPLKQHLATFVYTFFDTQQLFNHNIKSSNIILHPRPSRFQSLQEQFQPIVVTCLAPRQWRSNNPSVSQRWMRVFLSKKMTSTCTTYRDLLGNPTNNGETPVDQFLILLKTWG